MHYASLSELWGTNDNSLQSERVLRDSILQPRTYLSHKTQLSFADWCGYLKSMLTDLTTSAAHHLSAPAYAQSKNSVSQPQQWHNQTSSPVSSPAQ